MNSKQNTIVWSDMEEKSTNYFFSALREFKEAMDAVFVFPLYSDEKVLAHKVVLAAWSPVFRAMFYGGLKEKSEVKIIDFCPTVFQKMIDFMYHDELKFGSLVEAVEVYLAADKYDVSLLESVVETYLCSVLQVANCCEILDLILPFPLRRTKRACFQLIIDHTKQVIESQGFLNILLADTVNVICSQKEITGADELDMYRAVEKWLTADASREAINVRKSLKNIRFLTIPAAEVCKLKLLTCEERNAIVYNILSPASNDISIPRNLSHSRESRTRDKTATVICPGVRISLLFFKDEESNN